jgi:beta-lactam-binding protein with PASTA domain
VISTVPTGGATGPHGSLVVVTISAGPPSVAVPNVVGEQFTDAKLLLQQDKFVVGKPIRRRRRRRPAPCSRSRRRPARRRRARR